MKKRRLGKSDLEVSIIGLGCMSLGTDQKQAENILKTALDHGINYFDTADLYDFGINEKIIGNILQSVRDEVIIATKVGNRWNDVEKGWRWAPSKVYIKEAVKDSLRRLQTDYIDLYQLHGGTIDDPIDEIIEAFEELIEEGIIRYYGISSIRPNVIQEYIKRSSIISVMMQYSLLDRRPEELMPVLTQKGIRIVTRGSLAKGILSNIALDDDRKIGENGYLNYSTIEIKELHDSIRAKLMERSRTLTEVALQFVLAQRSVASVVTGASSTEQILENIQSAQSNALSDEELAYLQMITKENIYVHHRQ